jgi:hypothetical protein
MWRRLRKLPLRCGHLDLIESEDAMHVENAIFVLAGTLILLGTVLALLVSPWFLLLTGFVGANMFQSAFTGFCPAEIIFRKLGMKSCCQKSA